MTKEQIQDRMKALEANILAMQGALQDCQYWQEQLNKETPDPVKEETVN